MITKKLITDELKVEIHNGKEVLDAVQHLLVKLCKKHRILNQEGRATILYGLLYFAGEISGEVYGDKEFDLIMSKSIPYFRKILEKE